MGGAHIDIEGIPFQLNANLTKDTFEVCLYFNNKKNKIHITYNNFLI